MYIIDPTNNRIQPLQTKTFSELRFTERNHLQEWLAHQPSALGEELLIIQKEFDGFDDTRERLDLLAVDKDGNLLISVVAELKQRVSTSTTVEDIDDEKAL